VAESWSEAGVSTVEEAENLLLTESDAFRAVCREFGIDGTPGASQIRYIRTWAREWHLPAEVIREACARTMTRKGPNFPYANTILKEWHEADVKSSEDIAKRDEDHRQAEAKKHPAVTRDDRKKSRTDRFGDFTQREYSAETLAEIEKKMRQR
jgi:DnaD/phage-associated family protein